MPPTEPAETDPRVTCPIVAGEFMRANGFFFEQNDTYLVTARHNILPTVGLALETGDFEMHFEALDEFKKVDVYLRSGETFTVKSLNLQDLPCAITDPYIDIMALQIPFDPKNYGYTVFGPDDIVDGTNEWQTFDTIGFPGQSFPNVDEYDTKAYIRNITGPRVLPTSGPLSPTELELDKLQNIAVTHVDGSPGTGDDYEGLSGSPVLGDGLAGIHTMNLPVEIKNPEPTDGMVTVYWKAKTLLNLLSES